MPDIRFQYMQVGCLLIKTYANRSIAVHRMNHKVIMDKAGRPLDETVCNLIPGSHYNCSVSANNQAGRGLSVGTSLWTPPNSMYAKYVYVQFRLFSLKSQVHGLTKRVLFQ